MSALQPALARVLVERSRMTAFFYNTIKNELSVTFVSL
jgi:hypothetical protein